MYQESFAGENFRELLKVWFSRLKHSLNDEWDWIGTNKMSKLESYKVATGDRGYQVYVVVWEAAVEQILPCKRERGKIHDAYAVAVVENNDLLIDIDATVLNKTFAVKTFSNFSEPQNLRKFSPAKNSCYMIYTCNLVKDR